MKAERVIAGTKPLPTPDNIEMIVMINGYRGLEQENKRLQRELARKSGELKSLKTKISRIISR